MILCDGNYGLGAYGMDLVNNWEPERSRVAKKKILTMLRQHSQYDSRLGFSFRVLVRVRVRLGLG